MVGIYDALGISLSGARAVETRQAATADAIANATTTGYRRVDVGFASLVTAGAGAGVQARPRLSATAGLPAASGDARDLAIAGPGFFRVTDGTRTLLTRSGSFRPDGAGVLRNPAGDALLGADGRTPVSIPTAVGGAAVTGIDIGADGRVTATLDTGATAVVATIPLVTVANPSGLDAVSGTAFAPTAASGDPVVGASGGPGGRIVDAALDAPDVDLDRALVDLVVNRTTYAANLRALAAAAQLTDRLLDIER